MINPSQQLSDLESLTSAVDYDMREYDQSKVDALARAAKAMSARIEDIFGVDHHQLCQLINNAHQVADTDRDEWEGNNL